MSRDGALPKSSEPFIARSEPFTHSIGAPLDRRGWPLSVDSKRVDRLNRGSSVRWNRGGYHRSDKEHKADGDEHDWIL
jgi:hypothetical protein